MFFLLPVAVLLVACGSAHCDLLLVVVFPCCLLLCCLLHCSLQLLLVASCSAPFDWLISAVLLFACELLLIAAFLCYLLQFCFL